MQVTVDNCDNSIRYSDNWSTTVTGGLPEYKKSVHATCLPGATFQYNFTGDSVDIYGIPGEYQATSSYTIDSTHTTSYTEPHAPDQTSPSLFFGASALGGGPHTITVTFDHSNNAPADGDNEHRCFSFDYLTYTPSADSFIGSRRDDDNDKNEQSKSRHNGQGHGRRNDMIVGIVLASLAAVLACIAAFWFWRKYRKMKRMLEMVTGKDAEYGGGNNKGPSVVVIRSAESAGANTAIFSSHFAPSGTPYSFMDSDRSSLPPRAPSMWSIPSPKYAPGASNRTTMSPGALATFSQFPPEPPPKTRSR